MLIECTANRLNVRLHCHPDFARKTGPGGFEPPHRGIKPRCLAVWRWPVMRMWRKLPSVQGSFCSHSVWLCMREAPCGSRTHQLQICSLFPYRMGYGAKKLRMKESDLRLPGQNRTCCYCTNPQYSIYKKMPAGHFGCGHWRTLSLGRSKDLFPYTPDPKRYQKRTPMFARFCPCWQRFLLDAVAV